MARNEVLTDKQRTGNGTIRTVISSLSKRGQSSGQQQSALSGLDRGSQADS